MASATPATAARLDRRLVTVMAIACGAAIANPYYAHSFALPAGVFGAQGLGRQADAGRGRPATGLVLVATLPARSARGWRGWRWLCS